VWVHGATGGVRGLWSANHINGVLSGERGHAKQQYGSPEEQRQQLFHRFSLCCNYAKLDAEYVQKQFVPREMK
jgi:hypothetical protein